ncbi:MAG: hypothetical protein Q9162_000441 [Coniocarpon cinnabarinum]
MPLSSRPDRPPAASAEPIGDTHHTSNGPRTSKSRPTAVRPPASRLSRPGDVAKAVRPPASRLSRPGDVAKSQRPSSRALSRPGDVVRAVSSSTKRLGTRSRVTTVRDDHKRKSSSPVTPAFGSDSEGESDTERNNAITSKKPKLSSQPHSGSGRSIRDTSCWSEDSAFGPFDAKAGSDLLTGIALKDYADIFQVPEDGEPAIDLTYPSAGPQERFLIKRPKKEDYNPHDDICETMRQVLQNYFPINDSRKHLDEASGYPYRLTRAFNRRNWDEYRNVVEGYNSLLKAERRNGVLQSTLDSAFAIPLPMVQRILDQITARVVSPNVDLVKRAPEQWSRNVYGELLAPFNSHVFRETRMDSSSVFLDLGSGVGNVVLQAALEIGCESHGIEEMEECCNLARQQEAEFNKRCRMWGVSHGTTDLLQGNFLEDTRLGAILQRVDVILVNNYIFPAEVNDQLTRLFLDLKDGVRIVSLKSFVPEGWHLDERRRESVQGTLEVEKKQFWSGCVSWSAAGGEYFVATKDTQRIERILGKKRR